MESIHLPREKLTTIQGHLNFNDYGFPSILVIYQDRRTGLWIYICVSVYAVLPLFRETRLLLLRHFPRTNASASRMNVCSPVLWHTGNVSPCFHCPYALSPCASSDQRRFNKTSKEKYEIRPSFMLYITKPAERRREIYVCTRRITIYISKYKPKASVCRSSKDRLTSAQPWSVRSFLSEGRVVLGCRPCASIPELRSLAQERAHQQSLSRL